MNKLKAKKLNNHQRLIAVICLVVVAILAISVTFAWFTNKISLLNGHLTIGSFDYKVTVYNSNASEELEETRFTTASSFAATGSDWTISNLSSNAVYYKIVKVENNSGFGINPYSYVTYNVGSSDATTPNYFYYKSFNVTDAVESAGSISSFVNSYTVPSAATIAADGNTFGTVNNNAMLLADDSVATGTTEYYVVAYAVYNLPNSLQNNFSLTIKPFVAIAQSNGPSPQSNSAQTYTADTWQAFRSAVASAKDGDTIFLTGDVSSPENTNLSLTNGVNLHLNDYNLTIHGDLSFTYETTAARKLTVPMSSTLRVDGNLEIDTIGPFNISGSGSSQNIILGKYSSGEASGGKFLASCGLDVTNGTGAGIKPASINENSGLIVNAVQIRKYNTNGNLVAADLTLTDNSTMVKIGAGTVLNSVIARSISNIYVVNYGTITNLNLSNVVYRSQFGGLQVGLYVSNHNAVTTLNLPSAARGYKYDSSGYNTRVINASGCSTTFSGNYSSYFRENDIEPFNNETTSIVRFNGNGSYTVILNSTSNAPESISGLITANGYALNTVEQLKIETNNGVSLQSSQFTDLRNQLNIKSLDLSAAAISKIEEEEIATIPANAFLNETSLTSVTFPVTELSIGDSAFEGTKIAKVTIGSNIQSIGADAFATDSAVTSLEVQWESSVAPTTTNLLAFDSNKTIIFMDASLARNANYGETWNLNIYEFYDYKAGDFYCKYLRDGSSTNGCQIVYFSGSLSDYNTNSVSGTSLIPATGLSDGQTSYPVAAIGRQAYKKAIKNDSGTSYVNLVFPASCGTVGDSAFEGISSSDSDKFKSNILSLSRVYDIGKNAFRYNSFSYSESRPAAFTGMLSLGSYAFANSKLSGGVLDLHGVQDISFKPSAHAFDNFVFSGTTSSGNPYDSSASANAYFNLSYCLNIRSDIALHMTCYADLNLSHCSQISSGAFMNATIKTRDSNSASDLVNVVDVREVSTIGANAFKHSTAYPFECKTFMIGTSEELDPDAYEKVIGATSQLGIVNFVLDGNICSDDNSSSDGEYTFSSKIAGENIYIGTLEITNNCTEIATGAFATNATTFNADNNHLCIAAIKTYEQPANQGDPISRTPFKIRSRAFFGVKFSSGAPYTYNLQGVTEVGSEAFACSTIEQLALGTVCTKIDSPDFIKYCNNISYLSIMYSGICELVSNTEHEADPTIINTNGQRQEGFKIDVPLGTDNATLLGYIADDVWEGWKNYFRPLSRTITTDVDGKVYEDGEFTWSYYIIDPDDESMGIQIISCQYTGIEDISALTIPGHVDVDVDGDNTPESFVTAELGGEGDVFKGFTVEIGTLDFTKCSDLRYVSPDFLDSDAIMSISNAGGNYAISNGGAALYRVYGPTSARKRELVRVLPSYSANNFTPDGPSGTRNKGTITIQTGAFRNCLNITKFTADSALEYIQAGAFTNSGITDFDLRAQTTTVIRAGEGAFGEARQKQMTSDGYYKYVVKPGYRIVVPDSLYSNYSGYPAYQFYADYGTLKRASDISSVQNGAKKSKVSPALDLKDDEFDTTLSGINYHVMNSGGQYNDVKYTSDKTDFVAVVTSLTDEMSQSKTVIIPSSIIVDGVSYTVVGIDRAAFGNNKSVEKVVLPSAKDFVYDSQTFANCSALGYIQFNDVAPYSAADDNSVASLPVASAQSLTESSRKDDDD